MTRVTFFNITLLGLLTLSSCSIDKGFVARDWSENLRELNIQPIFPPREDVQVGDVYLLPYTKEKSVDRKKNFTPIGTWINSINLNEELKAHYRQRPDFPKTTSKKDATSSMEQQPTSKGNLFAGGDVNRLKMVLLPTFFKAEISAFDATSLIPSSKLEKLGVSAENIKKAFVTISSASSYGIPIAKVKHKFFEDSGFCINKVTGMDLKTLKFTVDSTGNGRENNTGDNKKAPRKALLIIATEVFYARTLKVQLSIDKSIGAGNTTEAQGISNKPGTVGSNPNTAEAKLAERELNTLVTPGVSVNVGSSAHGSVSIDRTFERPIAIGFRGIRQIVSLDEPATNNGETNCQIAVTTPVDSNDSPAPAAVPPPPPR